MKGNLSARQLGHADPHRQSAVSGARPIEAIDRIEVEDTWLEFEDVADLDPGARLETVEREHRQALERVQREAEARIAAVERERDAALAMLDQLRFELSAITAASTPQPEAEAAPRVAPAPPRTLGFRDEPRPVPTLSEVIVVTELELDAADRRNERRIQREFELEFNYETHFFAGLSLDISTGGLFIATYHLLPVGTALSLSFQLPDGARLSVRGEVRWVRCASEGHERPGMGVAFKELSAETLAAITRFCADRPPLYMDL